MRIPKQVALLCATLLMACNPVDPANPVNPEPQKSTLGDFSIVLAQDILSLDSGSKKTVNVTLTPKDGFKESVTLALVGMPTEITGTFDPNPSSGQTTLTLNVAANAAAKTYDFFVKGSASVNGQNVNHTQGISVTVAPSVYIQVSGFVRDSRGQPLKDATVQIGESNIGTSDTGAFTIKNVGVPYTITVLPKGLTTKHQFVDLTRPDPNLVLFDGAAIAPTTRSSTISGELSAGTRFPIPEGYRTFIGFAGQNGGQGLGSLLATQGPSFSFNASWNGSTTKNGDLYVLQCKFNPALDSLCDSFPGYRQLSVELTDTVPTVVPARRLELSQIEGQNITVNVTLPNGGTLISKRVYMSLSEVTSFPIDYDPDTTTLSSTYVTPAVGLPFVVTVEASVGTRRVRIQGRGYQPNSIIPVEVPVPVELILPVGAPNNVAKNVTLNWKGTPKAVYILKLATNLFVYTTKTSYQAALNANTSYTFLVSSFGPFDSVDDFAGYAYVNGYPVAGHSIEYIQTSSATGTFKTAP
jgi:hypothetical protein